MGVRKFTTFLNRSYRWIHFDPATTSGIVIDGSNLCCSLYSLHLADNSGGEYHDFAKVITKFVEGLPTVPCVYLMDGTEEVQEQNTVTMQRKQQSYRILKDRQIGDSQIDGTTVLPLLVKQTFILKMKDLGQTLIYGTSKDDRHIALTANHLGYQVLSSDSDFCIYDIPAGVINMQRYLTGVEACVYTRESFMNQHGIRCSTLMYSIPAFLGNDRVNGIYRKWRHNMDKFFRDIAKHADYASFEAGDEMQSYKIAPTAFSVTSEQYALPVPVECIHIAECRSGGSESYGWMAEYPGLVDMPMVMQSMRHQSVVLPVAVDVCQKSSSWGMSLNLRKTMYALLNLTSVTEWTRVIGSCYIEPVEIRAESGFVPLEEMPLRCVATDRRRREFSNMFSRGGMATAIEHVKPLLRLPLLCTSYWYSRSPPESNRKHVVMCLLLSFMMCNGDISKPNPNPNPGPGPGPDSESGPAPGPGPGPDSASASAPAPDSDSDPDLDLDLDPVADSDSDPDPDPDPDPVAAIPLNLLHSLSEWQCIYFVASILNCMHLLPFDHTSPGLLYGGSYISTVDRLLNKYAAGEWPSHIFGDDADKHAEFTRMYDAVLS